MKGIIRKDEFLKAFDNDSGSEYSLTVSNGMVTFKENSNDIMMKDVQLYKDGNKYNASYEFQGNENDGYNLIYYKVKLYIESDLTNFKYIRGILGEGYADDDGQRIDINFGWKVVYTNSLLNN